MAEIRVRIKAEGGASVRRAINGTTQASENAARQQAGIRQRDAAHQQRLTERVLRRITGAKRKEVEEFVRGERQKQRAIEQTAREATTSARSAARAQSRAQRGFGARFSESLQGRLAGPGAILSGLGLFAGIASAGAIAASLGQGVIQGRENVRGGLAAAGGVQDVSSAVSGAANFDLLLRQISHEAFGAQTTDAEFSQRVAGLQGQVLSASRETGVAPEELLQGLVSFQRTFSNLDFGADNLTELATAAAATGEDFDDLVNVLGEAQQQFGLTNDEAGDFLAILAEQGKAGAVDPGEISQNFARFFGTYGALTGRDGLEGFREFGALAQVQRRGGGDPSIVATRLNGVLNALASPTTQTGLAAAGVQLREFASEDERQRFEREQQRARRTGQFREEALPTGAFRSFSTIFDDIEASGKFDRLEDLQRLIPDQRAAAGLETFLSRRNEGQYSFEDILNVDEVAGRSAIQAGFRRTQDTAAFRARRTAAGGQAAAIENLAVQDAAANDQLARRERLKARFPVIGEALLGVPGAEEFSNARAATQRAAGDNLLAQGAEVVGSSALLGGFFGPLVSAINAGGAENADTGGGKALAKLEEIFGFGSAQGLRINDSSPLQVRVVGPVQTEGGDGSRSEDPRTRD